MGPIVANEDLLFVVNDNAIRKFEMLGTAELLEYVARLIEYDNAHDLALDDDDAPFRVDGNAARMLQYVSTEFSNELSVLIVNLYLMGGRSLGDYDVTGGTYDRDPIRIQQLSVPFAALTELKLESTLLVKYLYTMIVRVGDYDVILCVNGDTRGLGELSLHNTEFTELAMVNHFLSLYLRLQREYSSGRHELGGKVEDGLARCRVRCYGYRGRHWEMIVARYNGISVATTVAPFLVGIRVHAVQIELAYRRRKGSEAVGRAETFRNDAVAAPASSASASASSAAAATTSATGSVVASGVER